MKQFLNLACKCGNVFRISSDDDSEKNRAFLPGGTSFECVCGRSVKLETPGLTRAVFVEAITLPGDPHPHN